MDVGARIQHVESHGLCFNCLIPGHQSRDCRRKSRCNIDNCGQKHNVLLHTPSPTLSTNVAHSAGISENANSHPPTYPNQSVQNAPVATEPESASATSLCLNTQPNQDSRSVKLRIQLPCLKVRINDKIYRCVQQNFYQQCLIRIIQFLS